MQMQMLPSSVDVKRKGYKSTLLINEPALGSLAVWDTGPDNIQVVDFV